MEPNKERSSYSSRIGVGIRLSVWLVSEYAHVT